MPEPFSLDQAAAALDAALASRGPEPVVLVGHSLGGLVCAAEAIQHPQRVRALGKEKSKCLVALSGVVSPRLRQELESRGFTVQDRLSPGPLK